uniref:Uncharacterized protein n=1 Tax=Steinernema glaseri TaxID=37863 RepID=A0A1I7ZZ27_9BILA
MWHIECLKWLDKPRSISHSHSSRFRQNWADYPNMEIRISRSRLQKRAKTVLVPLFHNISVEIRGRSDPQVPSGNKPAERGQEGRRIQAEADRAPVRVEDPRELGPQKSSNTNHRTPSPHRIFPPRPRGGKALFTVEGPGSTFNPPDPLALDSPFVRASASPPPRRAPGRRLSEELCVLCGPENPASIWALGPFTGKAAARPRVSVTRRRAAAAEGAREK